MLLYSTNNKTKLVDLKTAVLKGLPEDNGLYMPLQIPKLSGTFLKTLPQMSFSEIAFEVAKNILQNSIPVGQLQDIIQNAINFQAPLVQLEDDVYCLELFHGPTGAFKDFGARFMAQLMRYFNQDENKELVILVATSGDTGGAVAAGFSGIPGVRVVILYPSGMVSPLQEKQLTTHESNISAIEVAGSFDDCQHLVKKAFLDKELSTSLRLSSANSINIARLIPQSFYYFEGYKQIQNKGKEIVFSVPSGNFGNLCAGLFAKKMGLPIRQFIAATNLNRVVPVYLERGQYTPKKSIQTISNAMDVGNPSNFHRILDLYGSTWNIIRQNIKGYSYSDEETRASVYQVYKKYSYILDPHGAIGYLALKEYQENTSTTGVFLETAAPQKFSEVVEPILKRILEMPENFKLILKKEKKALFMENDFDAFKNLLFGLFG